MVRILPTPESSSWLFGATLGVSALAALALAGLAGYCAWMRMPVPATHAAAASLIVCRRVRLLLLR
jgi:hypothetical protein